MEISLEHVQCDCGVQASVWWKAAAWGVWTEGYFWLFQCLHCKYFAAAELLLSSSLRIFEMTSDVRIPTVTFSMDVLSPRPHGVPCDTGDVHLRHRNSMLCKTGGGPLLASLEWVWSVSMYRVQYPAVQEIKKVAKTSTHTHTVTHKEGGKNFDSHTHSHATVAESLYGLQGALMTLGALPGASHSWSWLLKKRLPLLVTHDSVWLQSSPTQDYKHAHSMWIYIYIYIYTWEGPGVSGRKLHFVANPK